MTVTVSKIQRSTLKFDRSSTVLDLVNALVENLGGEWDNARLAAHVGGPTGTTADDGWTLEVILDDSEEPARASRWRTEDGSHVAVEMSYTEGEVPIRQCCCGVEGTDKEMAKHMNLMSGNRWTQEKG